MAKEYYNRVEIIVTEFKAEDVITTSSILPPDGGNDDLEFLPENY